MHRVIVGMVAALILLGALPTRALLIDFEEFGVPAGGNVEGQNRVSKGFLLESSHNHLINNQPGVTAWNDSTWLGNVGKLTLSNTDGSLFSLLSLQAAEFSFYERIFRMWHILHMPLFCLLIATGIAHIVAVHLY